MILGSNLFAAPLNMLPCCSKRLMLICDPFYTKNQFSNLMQIKCNTLFISLSSLFSSLIPRPLAYFRAFTNSFLIFRKQKRGTHC
ncbi:MAG TPA: hypothetical protein DHV48_12005 [Prolixibacteraceae bacterium]|nr:hypothetical protein [Prolixibacteraceae bacterium]